MKFLYLAFTVILFMSQSCDDNNKNGSKSLNCAEYWAQINFSTFCGLSMTNFDFNTIPNDICNADQNSSYTFDDLVSIRVFNHFSSGAALEEYDAEKQGSESQSGYSALPNVGDQAFGVIRTEFGELDDAFIFVVKNTYTVSLMINGSATLDANNCFDASTAVDFARILANPL